VQADQLEAAKEATLKREGFPVVGSMESPPAVRGAARSTGTGI